MTSEPCPVCRGLLYNSSDEKARSVSCLMCGRVWYALEREQPADPLEPAHRGRPRKERVV